MFFELLWLKIDEFRSKKYEKNSLKISYWIIDEQSFRLIFIIFFFFDIIHGVSK